VLAETATTSVFSLLSVLAIGRVIGPEAAGTGMIAIAAFALLDMLGATLFPDSLVQRPGLQPRHVASALTVAVLVGCGTAAVLALGAPLLAHWTGAPEVEALARALAPLLPLSAFAGAASGVVLRDQRFALLACRVLVGQPLALTVGLALAATGWGAWAMIGNQAVATLAAFLLLLVFGRVVLRPRIERAALAELWPVALPQVTAVIVMMGRYRVFVLALGFSVTEAVLAVSHVAFRMLDAAVLIVGHTTGRIGMPRLCALHADREAQAEAFGDLAQLQALLGMPMAAGIALTAPDLVQVLLGPAWAGAGEAARIAGFAALAAMLHGEPFSLFVARGRARWNVWVNLVALMVPLLALLVLRPQTPQAVALAWAAQALVMPPLLTFVILREIRRPLAWLIARVAPAVVATATMTAAVLTVQRATALGPAGDLAAAVAVGAVTYLAVAVVMLRGRTPRALRRQAAPLAA
jgi:O-antigen/teichoic acid export membrane protein